MQPSSAWHNVVQSFRKVAMPKGMPFRYFLEKNRTNIWGYIHWENSRNLMQSILYAAKLTYSLICDDTWILLLFFGFSDGFWTLNWVVLKLRLEMSENVCDSRLTSRCFRFAVGKINDNRGILQKSKPVQSPKGMRKSIYW